MVKRLFDIIVSGIALIFLSPLLVVISVWIMLDSPGPVFFRQERVGRYGQLFSIYKFRTMVPDAESKGSQVTAGMDPRITKAGQFLRLYKLDELPQLINVFMGDMSIVGPRPEVPKYVQLFEKDYKEILSLKPGITDYAAVEYRDEESILACYGDPEEAYIKEILPKKIELYKKYLSESSFSTDVRLIIMTLKKIL